MARVCTSCGTENPDQARFCFACATPLVESAPARKERKFATALFADVVGSTALAEREDPEVVQSLIGRTFERAATEIERHGGLLEKFIGDAILAVFGVPTAHEDDPERAVRAALAVREVLDDLNRGFAAEGRPELAMRIGIEAGEVLVDLERAEGPRHGMLTGDAVNTAARLQQASEPGQIVVGSTVHDATAERIEYRALPPLELKGKTEPVPAWGVQRVRAGPRGERAPLRLEARMVGRDEELATLERALARVRTESRPALVTVIGPAGIGKSRLAFEFLWAIEHLPEPVSVRKGRCLSYGNVSYSALAEAVKAECGVLDDDPPEAVVSKTAAAVERLFGDRELTPHVEALIGSGREHSFGREDLFDAWRRVLERMASRSPLVLVLEDLHWADDGLLDFVQHVTEWAHGPILLLALSRPEMLEHRPGWGEGRRASTIALDPLTPQETQVMLQDLLATRLPAELTRIVLERGEGNPLFGEEIVRMLIDRGAIRATEAAGWELVGSVDEIEVPRSIQALVAARLDALPGEEKTILQDAAVVGRTFWAGALGRLSSLSDERVRDALGELQMKELVLAREPPSLSGELEFSFRHVVIRDVAYDSLPKALRAEKHVATARWAEEQAGHRREEIAELLATHHLQALHWLDELGETNGRRRDAERDGYRWARAAGERAQRLWQQREAVRWFRAALDIAPRIGGGDEELAPLWESYAVASEGVEPYPEMIRAWEESLARYERVAAEADAGRVEAQIAHAALWAGRFDTAGSRAASAVQRLEPLGEGPALAFALFALGRYELELDRIDRAEPLLRRARDIAGRVGDLAAEANATVSLGWTLHARGRGEETVRLFDEALEAARQAGDLSLILDTLEAVLSGAIEVSGDYPRAEALSRESIELAGRAGNLGKLSRAHLNLGYLLRELGRVDEADVSLEAARASAVAVGDQLVAGYSHAIRALGSCARGELDDAEQSLGEFRAILEGERIDFVMFREELETLIAGQVALGRGRDERAADILVEGSRGLTDEHLSVWVGQLLLLECVKVLVRLGRREEALHQRDRLASLAAGNVPPRAFLTWVDGLLEPNAKVARDHLADAVARFEALGRPIELGRCLIDLAGTEHRLGEDPGPTLARARDTLGSCGAVLFLRDAEGVAAGG
ncbi:MAG TPA: adenylate/guanylate cyclase domain-containing protein [Actinomycetota bacterium]|nr:adenylate/guanylate cyclase domain-containing protein [Actinomycetota bacterium]